jgi:hypothetical protein
VELSRVASKRLALTDVLASPEAFTGVPLRTGGFSVRDAEGQLRVGILVEPAEATASLSSVGAILVDEGGRVAGRWLARDASERPLLGAIVATPGSYRLRVAAVDSEGRVGAAEDTIDAGLVQVGPIALGSVMLGVSRTGTTVLQLEFGSEPTALATFDIYGGDAGMKLGAAVEVARSLDGPALATLPVALSRADNTRVIATGVVPVGALTPGDYVVRGTVRLEDGTTGRVTRTLRKVK